MNKEYKHITKELIEVINETGETIERQIENGNPTKILELENKIETIGNIEKDINKKIDFRKDFSKFAPLWIKVHMSIPIITLIFLITSCLTGWIYNEILYIIIYYCSLYSFVSFNASIIVGIIKLIVDKDINGLISKLEELNSMKEKIEKRLLKELSENKKLTNSNEYELNKTIPLKETLTRAEETVLKSAYANGFTKKLVKIRKNNHTR